MVGSGLRRHGSAWLVVVAGLVGCSGESQVASCPAVPLTCPATAPDDGAACPAGAVGSCEYGDDALFECDTIATCYLGTWSVASAPVGMVGMSSCPTTPQSGCPASFADATAGFSCASLPVGRSCLYPEGKCQCNQGDAIITCTVPAAGCPATRPRGGTPCSGDCQVWGPGGCDGQSMSCWCGVWNPIYCAD